MARWLVLPFLLLLLSSSSCHAKAPRHKVRGMAFTSGHNPSGYYSSAASQSLRNLRATGAKYVHITAIHGQENLGSVTSYNVTSDADVRYIIRKARTMGFKVLLKPIVQTRNFEWRGFITGTPAWFANVYTPYMTRMALLAQQEGVSIFCVGSELQATLGKKKQWQRVISTVKAVYKRGYVTYVANHDSYFRVPFWRSLDFISISAYFRLADTWSAQDPPTQADTNAMWAAQARALLNWRRRAGLQGKKILIAEAGAMSKGNGVTYTQPWDYDVQAPTDKKVQAVQYQALLKTFMPPRWSLGVVLYDWQLNPNAGKGMPSVQAYTPQNKPAQQVMTTFFKRNYPATA